MLDCSFETIPPIRGERVLYRVELSYTLDPLKNSSSEPYPVKFQPLLRRLGFYLQKTINIGYTSCGVYQTLLEFSASTRNSRFERYALATPNWNETLIYTLWDTLQTVDIYIWKARIYRWDPLDQYREYRTDFQRGGTDEPS